MFIFIHIHILLHVLRYYCTNFASSIQAMEIFLQINPFKKTDTKSFLTF